MTAGTPFVPRNEESLEEHLHAHGIATDTYGQGTAKPLSALYDELRKGESLLVEEGSSLRQVLEAVTLRVTCGGLLLRESRQELSNGLVRIRDFQQDSVSEKMLPGETVRVAAIRALQEELGLDPNDYRFLPTRRRDVRERLSIAFPGLPGRFILHRRAVEILPSGFRAEGYEEHQEDKTTFFDWVPA